MQIPKVSVILTSFNHAKYICEAIDSTLNQTFGDFELIILDDCSSDNSWDLINQYSDPRIKALRNEVNKGPVEEINRTITEIATGEYIAIHHSDDVWELDKLEKQVNYLDEHPEIGAVFSNALAITENSSPLTDDQAVYTDIFNQPNRTRHEWLRFFLCHGNALCHPSILIRKLCYQDCGLYRSNLAQLPDLDMWIRLCLKHEIHVLPEKLIKFRVRDNEANTSASRPETRIRTIYEFYKLLPNYLMLTSFNDLKKVFPSAEKYNRNEETDIGFVLGMAVLELGSFPFTQLFGQDLLFEAISDPVRAANIKRLYNFDHKSFIALTGEHDVFSREEIVEKLNAIFTSYSWRLTRPLRFFTLLIREPKTLLARLQGKPRIASLTSDISLAVPFDYPMEELAPSLALICHVYYVDILDEIAGYFCNIPFPFDLYITTDTQEKQAKIQKFFSQWSRGKVEIRIALNRGRDIAPKLITCRDVYDNYEFILYLHTKKSPHFRSLRRWRGYLMETLIGSTEVVKSVFETFRSSPNIGIIAPQHLDALGVTGRWDVNFKIAQRLARRMGIKISRNDPIDFPSGSMFWFRSAAIKPLLDCKLSFDEFPIETNQVDKTLGHAIERLYFLACEQAGYDWIKISRPYLSGSPENEKRISSHDELINFVKNHQSELIKKTAVPGEK